jgi:cytochrome c-type biogenesis protein CcsB
MLKKVYNLIYSTKTMAFAIVVFFVAMAIATFVENDYGTSSAKALIYNAKWFEFILLLLTVNFVGNIFKFRMYQKDKWPVFLFHVAFIMILLGAFVTRYYSFEGIMPIREGAKSSTIYSDKTYINVKVDNQKIQNEYEWEVLFSKIGNKIKSLNNFNVTDDYNKQEFNIKLLSFIPNAKETFVEDKDGELTMQLVESSSGVRNTVFLKSGEIVSIKNILFSLNNPIEGGMNIVGRDGQFTIQSPFEGETMVMTTQERFPVKKDTLQKLHFKQLYGFGEDLQFVIKNITNGKVVKESASNSEKEMFPYDALKLQISSNNETKEINIRGIQGAVIKPENITVGGLNFQVKYGSSIIKTPFELQLRDFEMMRYPGSNSPSSYASEVTVLDKDRNFDFRIYMNHVLDHKGYRFYQASFDKDEKGTVLSVNHDFWGTLITYLGYFLMGLGMFFALFWKGTRFQKLSDKVKIISKRKFGVLLILLSLSATITAQNQAPQTLEKNTISKAHADKLGHLLIQDHQGRIKPINTYALEVLRKVYKKDTYEGLSAEQVLMSAQVRPAFWARQKIIKAKKYALGSELANELKIGDNKLASIIDFFNDKNQYILQDKVDAAFRKKKSNRDGSDNEIINLDEKANVFLAALKGSLMNIYPKKDDPNNKWYTGFSEKIFTGQDTMVLQMHRLYLTELNKAIQTGNYKTADEYLGYISDYQNRVGAAVLPSKDKVDLEIKYNKWNIFKFLLFYYMIIGFIFLVLAFADLFKPNNKRIARLLSIFTILTVIGMVAHIVGMGLRWYISGHEPWSNGYEAVVFVAFVTVMAGLIFSIKKSKFTLASTVIFSSFLLGIAHGSMMNPEVTNLVPVLKSYWLMIHVAVITSSYGFLGLSAILGLVVMFMFIIRNRTNQALFKDTIEELTSINEMSMTVGLYTLSLGTFLGGVWANESWGRYWSWDPKEVWSLISMMVYIFILHMRLVPGLRGKFAFNAASLWSIGTLIMTFFGVNFYLSGMHSYAAGDPVPIPFWAPVTVVLFFIFTIYSYMKYKKFKDV